MALNLLAMIVFICAIMVIMIAIYTWQHRTTNGARVFSVFMLSMAVYILAYSFELSSLNLSMMLFWNKIEYIGILSFPTMYLWFTCLFTGNSSWINKRNLVFLFLLPVIFLVIKFFDDSWHLIYQSVSIDSNARLPLLTFEKGLLYYVVVAYNLVMVTLSTFLLIKKRRHSSSLYRKQTNIILAVSLVLYFFYLVYISGFSVIPDLKSLDLNPFMYTLWGLGISYAIFRHRLFDLVPIARETLIETLADGVLVLDDQFRLVDANPKAQSIFGWNKLPLGKTVKEVDLQFADQAIQASQEGNHCFEIEVDREGKKSDFEVTISALNNNLVTMVGYLMVLHDITQRKKIEKELEELSLVDDLTGLTNRRGFFVLSEQLCNFCTRIQKNACLFFIDLDELKKINDSLGHAVGDQALIDMAQVLKKSFRSSDIVARFGGDEFVIFAIETAENSTIKMLNRMQTQRTSMAAKLNREYELSFSVGTALYSWKNPASLEDLLRESDQAMYVNKSAKKHK